jgi:hypothetical protein
MRPLSLLWVLSLHYLREAVCYMACFVCAEPVEAHPLDSRGEPIPLRM